jgi:glycosyltransferase involved in cell wall biosynthesis
MPSFIGSEFYSTPLPREQEPLVSVVTPVYNGADFLAECIESVLQQTYQNWDLTIVNNCSTDRTLQIAQEYASRETRIRIHNNTEFLPIIQNHNHAIHQISPQSKYCKVVLADDWLFPECIMKMVSLAEQHSSVGLVGAYGLDGDGMHVLWRGLPFPRTVVPGREVCRMRLLTGRYVFGAPTATLVRSDFIRSMPNFYDSSNLHADSTACFRLLEHSDFGFVHQLLTFTRSRGESNTSFAEKMNSIELSFLTELLEFGPGLLSDEEYQQRLQTQSRKYYQVLAEGLLQRRAPKYWQFHRDCLRRFGVDISTTGLITGFFRAFTNALLHPSRAVQSAVRWWSKAPASAPAERSSASEAAKIAGS